MGLFSGRMLPETKAALRETQRRNPRMKAISREAARSARGKGREDHRADADRRDGGFWRW